MLEELFAKIVIMLLGIIFFVPIDGFGMTPLGSRAYELYLKDGNRLIGFICTGNNGFSLKAFRGSSTFQITHVVRFSDSESHEKNRFSDRFNYLKRECGNSRSKLYMISQRLVGEFNPKFNNVTFKLNQQVVHPEVLDFSSGKQVGILYSTFHCPISQKYPDRVKDVLRYIRGESSHLGPLNWHHWVEKPLDGYYCLSDSNALIDKHAFLLTNAGVDYIFIDLSNWPRFYRDGEVIRSVREKLVDPVKRILDRYSYLHVTKKRYVPKIVFFMGMTTNIDPEDRSARWLKRIFNNPKYRGLLYVRPGKVKPLLHVKVQTIADDKVNKWERVKTILDEEELVNDFEIIPMWGNIEASFKNGSFGQGLHKNRVWSYVEQCAVDSSGNIVRGCNQRMSTRSNQIAVSPAAKTGSAMNHKMQRRRGGRTLFQQMSRALQTDVDNISISNWNAWVTRRSCTGNNSIERMEGYGIPAYDSIEGYGIYRCKENFRPFKRINESQQHIYLDLYDRYPNNPGDPTVNGPSKKNYFPFFIDHFVKGRSRNLEPSREYKDCYYQLMRYMLISGKKNQTSLSSGTKTKLENHCGFNLTL